MMKKIYLLFIFLLPEFLLQAQQAGIYSHSFYKPMVNNPAFTGSGESANAMLISRSQFISFKNAPQLNLFTLDGMLTNKKMGLGIDLFSDKKGISNKLGGNIYYSYWLKLNESAKLTFGLALGMMDHTLHYSEAVLENPSDPFITGGSQRETSINGHAGLGFIWKNLEAGISVPQLFGNSLEYQDNTSGKAYYALSRHYQGTLKYKYMLLKEKQISLSPMATARFHPNLPVQYDVNLTLDWKNKLWLGATYKNDYAISANAGFCLSKQLYIGYSYDFVIGNIGSYSGMSHELMINFVFGKAKPKDESTPELTIQASRDKEIADSLQTELEIKSNKIATYESKIEETTQELAKTRTENEKLRKTTDFQNSLSQNTAIIPVSDDKATEGEVRVLMNRTTEFKDVSNHSPMKGFYIVVGAYMYRDLALAEVKRFLDKGYKTTNWVYFEPKQYNYVFITRENTKEEALKKITEIKNSGVTDVWIQVLLEK